MPIGRHLLATFGLGALLAIGVPPAVAGAEPTVKSDEQGYPGTEAYCDNTQLAVVFGRTARSLVTICTTPAGGYEYRGVRTSDEAGLKLTARATSGGFVANNDAATTYTVSPEQLLVTDGGKVIYRDTWIEFEQPRFSAG
ncbi:hypothetical protein BH11ACT6_BH11ACT6_10980 [soil metagenome]